ncbi:cellobiose dehydrogenase [Phyllosticta capitalensis]|uniref:Cellobiose dehydrogenase n=1 Tax=Phyllosticta capitalensis TaxID=121624 RepID=A0ABR1YHD9_9PEZI
MKLTTVLTSVLSFAAPLVSAATEGYAYTDETTGIKFWQISIATSNTAGGFEFGFALPDKANAGNNDEYIGRIVGSRIKKAGWSGVSHAGGMTSSLLLLAWADDESVRTSFRYATGYTTPKAYTGNATLSPISHTVNDTNFELIYRCQWCWFWDQDGSAGSQPPTGESEVIGWAQSVDNPSPVSSESGTIEQHSNGMGQFGLPVASARNADYTNWVSKATVAPTATATQSQTVSATATSACSATNAPNTTYDYIVVGAGAAGIPLADKLSEAGKSVLLVERGPPSSGRWVSNGSDPFDNWRPEWLSGTNLTRFDVPGLINAIWSDSANIACTDFDQMAGCILGGGTAINSALWWKAPDADWDTNFPTGWKAADMSAAVERVFDRIPSSYTTSMDGKLYQQQGFQVVQGALAAAGWMQVVANDVPNNKNHSFSLTPYAFSHGERGGPMATYLVSANSRKNFKMVLNTSVRRVVRKGGRVTGVEVESNGSGGLCGTINVTPSSGRVILSAGTFGTPKILFRSGIGPEAQLKVVNGSETDGATMISQDQWIELPVGQNLNDHVNTNMVFSHKNVTQYKWDGCWDSPVAADKSSYLNGRTGMLAQASPNIGPIAWDEITGSDGIARQIQWTTHIEGSTEHAFTISQNLGRGTTSRGVLTIDSGLSMTVSTKPWLRTDEDKAAVVQGVKNMLAALKKDPGITWISPAANTTAEAFVKSAAVTSSKRTSNHWVGTAKMGTDSGLENGSSVVDTNTKVYGTDNLYVVDASIFPNIGSTNPSALIVAVAEKAAEKLLQAASSKA